MCLSHIEPQHVLQIMQTLIRMRSCEPGWDELDIVRYIESLFSAFPVYINVIQHGNNRASLVVTIEGKERNGRKRAMMGHIDTMVPYNPQDWTYGPFSGHCADGMVYGVGASNAKSGVAAMLAAALSILKNNEKPANDLMLCFTADSDGKGIGARMLLNGGFLNNMSEMFFCDPTGSDISVAQKGTIWLAIEARGHSRHIMEAAQAVNALDGILKFSEKLSSKFNKISKHHILGGCAVNLTQVATHDNATWMVPGYVTGRIDIRITPSFDIEKACDLIDDVKKQIENSQRGLSIKTEIINKRPAVGIAPDAPLVRQLERISERLGRKPKIIGQSFYTDASTVIPELGIPFIAMGPGGRIFNDREDEHVALDDAVFVSNVYRCYMTGGIDA